MNTWPSVPFLGSLHPAGAQNKTLIANTDMVTVLIDTNIGYHLV